VAFLLIRSHIPHDSLAQLISQGLDTSGQPVYPQEQLRGGQRVEVEVIPPGDDGQPLGHLNQHLHLAADLVE
jgi:hypothetical protein